jgi:hypothetical protein
MSAAPERRLMAAVLQDAIKCMRTQGLAADYRSKLLSRQARRWLLATDPKEPYSFLWICRALEFDPEVIRNRLGLDPRGALNPLARHSSGSSVAQLPSETSGRCLGR